MQIGIIGAGNVGGNLGSVWAAHGHTIRFGIRDPQSTKSQAALSKAPSATFGSPAEAAAFGEVVVIAVPSGAVRSTIEALGDLRGKIVIDTTNRLNPQPGDGPSAAEDIAALARGARVVKAFNTMGAETLLAPQIGGLAVTAFVCGDDVAAKETVMQLAREIGLDPVDAGPLMIARQLEGFVNVFAAISRTFGRQIGFRVLRNV
jgi:hypothetical protein